MPHRIIMKSVHWPLMGRLLHLVQRGGDWAGPQPAQASPRCTKCNSPPINGQCIAVLLYNGLLLCDFYVPFKGLTQSRLGNTSWHSPRSIGLRRSRQLSITCFQSDSWSRDHGHLFMTSQTHSTVSGTSRCRVSGSR